MFSLTIFSFSLDFTISKYIQLLETLKQRGYIFQTFQDYLMNLKKNVIVLRHDVDRLPNNSLVFANLQAKSGIKGTYYFRAVAPSFNEKIILKISSLGHEIGYHYETMDTCRGDIDKAYHEFCKLLENFRKIVSIKTISMHGSPLSKYDNRKIWDKYDYKKLGIIGEPYFDVDFNELFYITDTGRRWDGNSFNVRDKATKDNPVTNPEYHEKRFRTTQEIITEVNSGNFPQDAMFNFHPQRWNDKSLSWGKELIWQNIKNQGKRVLLALRNV